MQANGTSPFSIQRTIDTSELIPSDFVVPMITALLSGSFFTAVYFMAMQRFAGKLIWLSFLLNVGISLLLAVFGMLSGNLMVALFAGIYAVLHIVMYTMWKKRIPFATVMV
jgi:hypothetical protein